MQVLYTACLQGRAPAAPQPCFRYRCKRARCEWWSSTWCRLARTLCRHACKWGREPSMRGRSVTRPPRSECTAGSASAPGLRPDFLAPLNDGDDKCPLAGHGWSTERGLSYLRWWESQVRRVRTLPSRWKHWGTLACTSSKWYHLLNSLKLGLTFGYLRNNRSNPALSSYSTQKQVAMHIKVVAPTPQATLKENCDASTSCCNEGGQQCKCSARSGPLPGWEGTPERGSLGRCEPQGKN